MKIICLQENLIKGLQAVSHLAGKNINLPILNNVLIEAEDNQISLTTTNLEIGVDCKIRGKVEEIGKCTVNAKLLNDFVNLLPKDNVTLELEDDKLKIECVNDKTSINVLAAEEFPLLPKVEKKNKYSIGSTNFKNALRKVAFAVSMDMTRPEISGVLFDINKNKLILAGTDSYRLAEKGVDLDSSSGDKKIIIPIETIQEVLRISNDITEENSIEFFIEENQILFSFSNNVELVSRLIEGNYPDYKQIIPSEYKTKIEVDMDELVKSIKRTSLFCKPGINDMKLVFLPDKQETVLTSTSDQFGENITAIKSTIKGNENEIVFNYKYLLDGLNNLNSKIAILEIIDNRSAGILKSKSDEEYVYIVMPIKQ